VALYSQITGCGSYLPSRVVTNAELAQRVDTTDEWIRQRTGIRERRVADDNELTSDLGGNAAEEALAMARLSGADLDLIICATATPDETFPATATRIQERLGMRQGAAFDVQAVCAGFIYALAVADNFLRLGQARNALVIGAETFSRILDYDDRSTCVLFGDGAGAVVLQAAEGNGAIESGVLSTHLYSDGRHHDALYVDGGPSSTGTVGHVRMEGREVFRHAVVRMAEAIDAALTANGLNPGDIDWMVPHQANLRIIDAATRTLGIDPSRVLVNIERYGNTSNASVPLALDEAVRTGRLEKGQLVLLVAFGGGVTWGASLLRW